MDSIRIAFVHNFCSHYVAKFFESFARFYDVDYYFCTRGDEWYWLEPNGVMIGDFQHLFLPRFRIGRTCINPTLPIELLRGNYDVYIKCINGRFALPMTYLVAKLRRKPFILWTGIWCRLQTPFHRLFFPFTRFIYRHADAIVVYGEHVKYYLLSEGVRSERIFVAPPAVDNQFYNKKVSEKEKEKTRQHLGIGPEQKIILYVGRLEQSKGLQYLLRAFAALERDDAVLVLAGAGSYRGQLETHVRERGLIDRVRFPGYVPPEETVHYYASAWVSVLPSITTREFKEPWGLVVNEAFNQGLPVIVTDSVGAAAGGLVKHRENGFVIPERNHEGLAQALQSILDDIDLRRRLGNNTRRSIAVWSQDQRLQGLRKAIAYVLNKEH